MSKQLIATHDKVDPALVTSDDLVRAMQADTVCELAVQMGWRESIRNYSGPTTSWQRAAYYIAQRITLPEDEPLPFDDAINGVSQERTG